MSVFETLNSINVGNHIEKKANLSYLSWAWAWAEVKKVYPEATYKIYETEINGFVTNYFSDGKTCWVKTGVKIEGLEHIEELPVMDFHNKSISFDAITSMDVNKSIQRSLTKAVARHGLGLYIYAGEDLPESEREEFVDKKIDKKTAATLLNVLTAKNVNIEKLCEQYGVKDLTHLTDSQYANILTKLNKEADK